MAVSLSSALDKSQATHPLRSLQVECKYPHRPWDIEMDPTRPSYPSNNNDKTPNTATLHSPYTATVTPSHQSQRLSLSPEQQIYSTAPSSSRSKPRMPRSESFNPSPPHRPEMNRAAHSLYSMAGPGSASQVMFPVGGDVDNGNDDLTTKGRKRKRLAKACSACHVSSHLYPLAHRSARVEV